MPYEAAKLTVQTVEEITSRSTYWEWHDTVRPYYIPKMPHRVYKEWISWNDFLGVDNSWDGWDRQKRMHTRWMPYWEAVRTVQKLGLKSKVEYKEAYANGDIPENIPTAPDRTYGDDWTGWPSFLGKDIAKKVESAEKVVGILALCVSSLLPSNVIEVIIAPEGRGQLQDKIEARPDLRVGKAYVWEPELWSQVRALFSAYGTEQNSGQYVFANVNAVLYELDMILMIYRG